MSVDSVYARILVTVEGMPRTDEQQHIAGLRMLAIAAALRPDDGEIGLRLGAQR